MSLIFHDFLQQFHSLLSGLAQVAFGQHHVMLLDAAGKVFSLGRHDYGVLGLGDDVTAEVSVPTLVQGIQTPAVEIGCGTAVSYAVTSEGEAFSWGMGTNGQVNLNCNLFVLFF